MLPSVLMPRNRNRNRWWNPYYSRDDVLSNPNTLEFDDRGAYGRNPLSPGETDGNPYYSQEGINPDSHAFDYEESYGGNPSMTAEAIAKRDAAADRVWHDLHFARLARDWRLERERKLRADLKECEDYLDRLVDAYIQRGERYGNRVDRGCVLRERDDCVRISKRIEQVERQLTRDYEGEFREAALIKRLEEESALYDMEAAEVRGLRALEEDDD